MNILEKFETWPERTKIDVRLHLYDWTCLLRCNLVKLLQVFRLAEQFGVQEQVRTNLNKHNAVYIELDNFTIRHRAHQSANPKGWGQHWEFLLALIATFPGEVFIDPPEGTAEYEKGLRFKLGTGGEVLEEIQTWDDM